MYYIILVGKGIIQKEWGLAPIPLIILFEDIVFCLCTIEWKPEIKLYCLHFWIIETKFQKIKANTENSVRNIQGQMVTCLPRLSETQPEQADCSKNCNFPIGHFSSDYFPTGPALLRSLFFNSSKKLLLPKAMNNLWASLSIKLYCLTSFTWSLRSVNKRHIHLKMEMKDGNFEQQIWYLKNRN